MNHKASWCRHALYKHLSSYLWYLSITINGYNKHYEIFIQKEQIAVFKLCINYLSIDSIFENSIHLTNGFEIFKGFSADSLKVISFFLLYYKVDKSRFCEYIEYALISLFYTSECIHSRETYECFLI